MKLTKGKITFFARQFVDRRCIPIFMDRKVNKAIDKKVEEIFNNRTHRSKANRGTGTFYQEEEHGTT